jgi:hypothetical protein
VRASLRSVLELNLTRSVKRPGGQDCYAEALGPAKERQTVRREIVRSAVFGVGLQLVVLIGCSEATPDRSDSMDAGGHGEHLPLADGSAQILDGEPSAVFRDRCFGEACEPAVLPAQAERRLLEDAGDGWQRLIEADWQLSARSEGYRCVRKTAPRDVYVIAFSPLTPPGTHHTTLEINPPGGAADGVTWCAGPSSGGARQVQGSGVGTKPVDLPAGVAMKIAMGEQLAMNLHLFNVGDTVLTGTSGMWIKAAPAETADEMAEVVLAGPPSLSIPEGRSTQSGRCTFHQPAKIYSLGPHMHQLGAHMRVTAHSSIMGERVIHDAAYDFTHQLVYPVELVELAAGDWLSIECTYENTTGETVFWGDSSLDEMCFVNVGRFPAAGGSFCVD